MDNKDIFICLINAGMTPEGACGLMGNMQAESAMRSNNAQDGMTRLSDEEYTNAADNGNINFVRDAVGYGLCQWTYWSRKQALLNYAKSCGVSVGDTKMQIDFCIRELKTDYKSVWNKLCGSISVYDAASIVCTQYERPAVNNIAVRAKFAEQFYSQFAKNSENSIDSTDDEEELPVVKYSCKDKAVVEAMQTLLKLRKCNIGQYGVDGYFGNGTLAGLKEYQEKTAGLVATGECDKKTWIKLIKGE